MSRHWKPVRFLQSGIKNFINSALPDKALFLARLRKEWPAIVGASIASHSLPSQLRSETLLIFVDDPIWIQELTLHRDEIKDKMKAHFKGEDVGKLFQNLQFRNGPIEYKKEADEPESKGKLKIKKAVIQQIDETVGIIEDKDLKAALKSYLINANLEFIEDKKDD